MKKETFAEILNEIDDELIERADMVSDKPVQKHRKPLWSRYILVTAYMVLIISVCIKPIRNLFDRSPEDTVLPADIDDILWASQDNQGSNASDEGFAIWNGWKVDLGLSYMLSNADENTFLAVEVKRTDLQGNQFEYNGYTYDEIRQKDDDLQALRNKLWEFPKMGEWLKYGELLYTTGTPDGEKWSKEWYDETVAYYGEEFIDKYIVDGVVQTAQIEADLQFCLAEIEELGDTLSQLISAYHKSYIESERLLFPEAGVCAIAKNDTLFLFIQRDELANLEIADKEAYFLSLATRNSYQGSGASNDKVVPE